MKAALQKIYTPWGVLLALALFLAVYLGGLHPWMNRWGVSAAEASMPLPGDEAEPGWIVASTRGVTIAAPAETVWQWVVQLGQERAGFYSEDWLENLVLSNIHNSDEIRPEWQARRQGEHVLGAGGAVYGENYFWEIKVYEQGKVLYLWGSIVVMPVDAQTTRLLARSYIAPPAPLAGAISALTYDWMHFVMERGMLLGIKARAEGSSTSGAGLRALSAAGWLLAGVATAYTLFARRRGWPWGLPALLYAAAILYYTGDAWSALAGFLWWGLIIAGFLLWGRAWWKGLLLAVLLVILVFVLAPQPHTAFGVLFLLLALGYAVRWVTLKRSLTH